MRYDFDVRAHSAQFSERISRLLALVRTTYPNIKHGCICIPASYEQSQVSFRQDSNFYYLTGITEPAAVLIVDLNGSKTLLVPHYASKRSTWVSSQLDTIIENPETFGLDSVDYLGGLVQGYQVNPWGPVDVYTGLLSLLRSYIDGQGKIFMVGADCSSDFSMSRILMERLSNLVLNFAQEQIDISCLLSCLRRSKDMFEMEDIYAAVDLAAMAHQAVAQAIKPGVFESEVQAQIEYIYTAAGSKPSFPTIVASGSSTTILHYSPLAKPMQEGDLVIIDCGADCHYYCSDISRTYPVSGKFTKRQRALYETVLELQAYIAALAKPGFYLHADMYPEKSLNHLAKKFLAEKGLDRYYAHGIGHFLGLDVHDMGDRSQPLVEGDVITIEPGLYLPDEQIGIRIEDNYWITKNGAICLSEALPKKATEIELFMAGELGLLSDDESHE